MVELVDPVLRELPTSPARTATPETCEGKDVGEPQDRHDDRHDVPEGETVLDADDGEGVDGRGLGSYCGTLGCERREMGGTVMQGALVMVQMGANADVGGVHKDLHGTESVKEVYFLAGPTDAVCHVEAADVSGVVGAVMKIRGLKGVASTDTRFILPI